MIPGLIPDMKSTPNVFCGKVGLYQDDVGLYQILASQSLKDK